MKLAILTAAMLVATLALAGPPGGGMNLDRLAAELGLTDGQASQIEAIMIGHREHVLSLRDADRSQRRAQMQELRQDFLRELDRILDDEQMRRFEELLRSHGSRLGGGREDFPSL